MAKFDLHQLLNERSKAAAVEREKEPRTADGMEQLTLDVYDLIPSQENFYSTQYINDLKQSIAIVGLLQPLLVERDGDKFRVVAGHRRRLACMALVEDGLEQFRRVPCVTRAVEEEGTVKTILDRLALIFANGFREKSDWEKMEETLRTEALIAELRKEVEVEGRTRWITAEFTGITEAQIGRYKSIKNNLCPELMQAFSGLPGNVLGQICPVFGLLWFMLMPFAIWAEDTARWCIWFYEMSLMPPGEADVKTPLPALYSLKSIYSDFIKGK